MRNKRNSIHSRPAGYACNIIMPVVLFVFVLVFSGCASTRNESSGIYPFCDQPYQECTVNLTNYKSPQERKGTQDANLALAIAISGGGFRAANFGAGVLVGLEETKAPAGRAGNCLLQADYFSTVSGGGFIASTYIAGLHDYRQFAGSVEGYSFKEALQTGSGFGEQGIKCPPDPPAADSIQNFSTDPCIRRHLQGFYPDDIGQLLSDFFCWVMRNTKKSGKFERIIDDTFLGYNFRQLKEKSLKHKSRNISLTLGDIFIPLDDSNEVKLPIWVTNSTAYENGAIFPFTPDHLRLYNITGYRHRSTQHYFQPTRQNYEEFLYNAPVAVAVMASANFPGATYPTTLYSKMDPKNPYLHLFDGGMADNLAVLTAVRLLENEQDKRVSCKALIVIDAYQGTYAPFSRIRYPPPPASTVLRAMGMSLDSWRGRSREIIAGLCREKNISVVFLNFDDLVGLETCRPLIEFGLTDNDIKELTGKSKLKKPFDLLRKIPTIKTGDKGLLSNAEQNLLISAGRFVVFQKKDQILKVLGR
jgi:hypothetical protein